MVEDVEGRPMQPLVPGSINVRSPDPRGASPIILSLAILRPLAEVILEALQWFWSRKNHSMG